MDLEVFDSKGKPVAPKPIRAVLHSEKLDEVKATTRVNFTAELTLNRPGEFILRITLTDKMSKKSTTFEAPMRVGD